MTKARKKDDLYITVAGNPNLVSWSSSKETKLKIIDNHIQSMIEDIKADGVAVAEGDEEQEEEEATPEAEETTE